MAPIKHPPSGTQLPPTPTRLVTGNIEEDVERRLLAVTAATTISDLTADTEFATTSAAVEAVAASTTTITSSASGSTATSSSILAEAVATTHLSWWQLLAVILGGILVLGTTVWLWWKHRRKRKRDKEAEEKKKKKLAEEAKERKAKDALERILKEKAQSRKKRGGSETESESESEWDSESDDSVSDGGTIRPSKSRRRRRQRDRGRRDRYRRRRGRRRDESDSISDSESWSESDYSDETYYPRKKVRGRWRHENYDWDRRNRYQGDGRGGVRGGRGDQGYGARPAVSNRRGGDVISPPPPPVPPLPGAEVSGGGKGARKRDTFRDSVFSSYTSMKKAAVRLKYVEAKVKLKKQLEEEEKIEKMRKDKIKEANSDIERSRIRRQKEVNEDSQGSGQLLIPPAKRLTSHSSASGSSDGRTASLPTPPQRGVLRQTDLRGGSLDSQRYQPHLNQAAIRQLYPPIKASGREYHTTDRARHPAVPKRQESADSLGQEISHLLGNGGRRPNPKSTPRTRNGQSRDHAHDRLGDAFHTRAESSKNAKKSTDASQSDWLSRPALPPYGHDRAEIPSMPLTPQTESVYLPVTHPKMRPIIPKGGLAPAPPPRTKNSAARNPESSENGQGGLGLGAWIGAGLGMGATNKAAGGTTTGQGSSLRGSAAGSGSVGTDGSGVSGGADGAGTKWAKRLRERR